MEKLPPNLCNTCPTDEKKACQRRARPCHPVNIFVYGKKPLRESLVNINLDRYEYQDYKAVLIDRQEQTKKERTPEDFEEFKGDPRVHLITIALNAKMPIAKISLAMGISGRTIKRLKRLGK